MKKKGKGSIKKEKTGFLKGLPKKGDFLKVPYFYVFVKKRAGNCLLSLTRDKSTCDKLTIPSNPLVVSTNYRIEPLNLCRIQLYQLYLTLVVRLH